MLVSLLPLGPLISIASYHLAGKQRALFNFFCNLLSLTLTLDLNLMYCDDIYNVCFTLSLGISKGFCPWKFSKDLS